MNQTVYVNLRCTYIDIYFQFPLGIIYSPMLCLCNPKVVAQKQYQISAEIQFIFKSCIWDVYKSEKTKGGYAQQSRKTLPSISQI
jgi:hypothetical protein